MGYDLYWHQPASADEKAIYDKAREVFDFAVKERDALIAQHGRPSMHPAEGGGYRYEGHSDVVAAQRRVDAAYEGMYEAEPWYFRANIWSMQRLRQIMQRAGMLCAPDGAATWDSFPRFESEQWQLDPDTYYAWEEDPSRVTPEEAEKCAAFKKANDDVLTEHGGECPGIPIHKLSNNSGWIVVPGEINAALASERNLRGQYDVDAEDAEFWQDWLRYLESAAAHGGFEVH